MQFIAEVEIHNENFIAMVSTKIIFQLNVNSITTSCFDFPAKRFVSWEEECFHFDFSIIVLFFSTYFANILFIMFEFKMRI